MLIAVDIGKTGGIAVLYHDGSVEVFTMPITRLDYLELLEVALEKDRAIAHSPTKPTKVRAVIEKQTAMPSQGGRKMGAKSAFSFGQSYEMHLTMFTALKIPFELVTAKEWQKYLKLTKPPEYKKGKEYLRMKASEIFPDLLYGQTLGYQRSVCDALLILDYARLKSVDKYGEV